ncbi:sigma-54-dependent transcriptional regulator [Hwanghaeella sp.]|uniref:sigma-54-dependent transcriptional regulator FlbD n=1 Tax=Hwanghaeella sp. TaxID=2605943 RepID=UPI003CCC028D
MKLLIIGTLGGHLTTASQIAMKRGAKVTSVNNIDEALTTLRSGYGAEVIMVDARMNIADLSKALESERIAVAIIACGIEGTSPEVAVASIKAGAKEFLPLPPDPELIAAVFEAVAEENHAIIHRDPAMRQVLKLADQIAPSDASVLITGESGTGKEVMARYVHARSKRASGEFVALNCAAIPENLLESELFGHEKGAFSGAVARRIGKFEQANGGTLLLDEISEMDPRLQAKLLRAIQEREIDRVGGAKPVSVDVRLLATSNRNLEEEVSKGNFREDLYFRLNVVNLQLPSLREKPQDIPALAEHFAIKYAESNGLPTRPISAAAMQRLKSHHWPGNVRELENAMHRAVLLAQGDEIGEEAILLSGGPPHKQPAPAATPAAAPVEDTAPVAAPSTPIETPSATEASESAAAPSATGMVGKTVAEVERDLIIDTLQHCLGNRTHAANILGISIRTLRNKLKQYTEEGLAVPAPGDGSA